MGVLRTLDSGFGFCCLEETHDLKKGISRVRRTLIRVPGVFNTRICSQINMNDTMTPNNFQKSLQEGAFS